MAHSPDDDVAALLARVTDDLTPRQQCAEWLTAQMNEGRDADVLLAELVANGWSKDEVEPLVDEVRRKTRGNRSVLGARDRAAQASKSSLFAPNTAGRGIATNAILGAANLIGGKIGEEAREIRHRIKHGFCHQCGHNINDIKSTADRCPKCGSVIVRQEI